MQKFNIKWLYLISLITLMVVSTIGIAITRSPYWLIPTILGYSLGIGSAIIVIIKSIINKKNKK